MKERKNAEINPEKNKIYAEMIEFIRLNPAKFSMVFDLHNAGESTLTIHQDGRVEGFDNLKGVFGGKCIVINHLQTTIDALLGYARNLAEENETLKLDSPTRVRIAEAAYATIKKKLNENLELLEQYKERFEWLEQFARERGVFIPLGEAQK